MLLTTKQVAQKLGVHPRVVRGLINRNLLRPANEPKENAQKTVWEFDSKVVREFAATYVPVVRGPRKPKTNGNGHAPELPLDIPSVVALANALARIEDKLDTLLAVWEVSRPAFVTEAHLTFLEGLRQSGATNMWGAAPYLVKRFKVDKKTASAILVYWIQLKSGEAK